MSTGVQWLPQANGKVSTMASGKNIWVAVAEGHSADVAKQITAEKNWRNNYSKYVVDVAEMQAGSSDADVYASAERGIKKAYEQFTYTRGGETVPLSDAAALPLQEAETFTSVAVTGKGWSAEGPASAEQCHVEVSPTIISDVAALKAQMQGWAQYGSMEPSAVANVADFLSRPDAERAAFLRERIFVVLGATSAAGPTLPLLRLGATVVAVARPGKKLESLIATVKGDEAYRGVLFVPKLGLDGPQGADVLAQVPELVDFISSLPNMNSLHTRDAKSVVIGSYIYLDGEAHVRASVACDAITSGVVSRLGASKVELAYLGSPSIAHSITEEAWAASNDAYDNCSALEKLSLLRLCKYKRNSRSPIQSPKGPVYVTNGLVVFQGPNYALAKTLQSWRIILARRDGVKASANTAPSMYTESICHVPAAFTALNGMQAYPPLAAYDPNTVSPIMTYLMLWDLSTPSSTANPETPVVSPTQFFCENSFHGGMWRCAYEQESIGSSLYLGGKFLYSKPAAPPVK